MNEVSDHPVRRNFHNPTNLRDKMVSSSYSYFLFKLIPFYSTYEPKENTSTVYVVVL